MAKSIVALAKPMIEQYFENENFISQMAASSEGQNITNLKQLAQRLVDLAQSETFERETCKLVLEQLAKALTQKSQGGKNGLMNYEFRESGLLEAIELFLSRSPKQVQLHKERTKNSNSGEEMKHSEELMMSQMIKSVKSVGKKEARAFIQRLKIFAHVMLK